MADFLKTDVGYVNLIALHLGSGASVCAIKDGKSWVTNMELTPGWVFLEQPAASDDPSDVGKLSPASTDHLHISQAEEISNIQSGWKALTGTIDFRIIADGGEPKHKLAYDIFVDRVCGFIGSYYVSLGGRVDALVFAGGIGENSAQFCRDVVERASCLGFEIDNARNAGNLSALVEDLTSNSARHRVLVCATDEQVQMARIATEMKDLW